MRVLNFEALLLELVLSQQLIELLVAAPLQHLDLVRIEHLCVQFFQVMLLQGESPVVAKRTVLTNKNTIRNDRV